LVQFSLDKFSAAETNKHLFERFFSVFFVTDIFWTVTKWNDYFYFFFFLYAAKSRRKRNWTLKNFYGNNKKRKFQKGYSLINGAKLWYQMMQTSWSCNPHAKTPIPKKPSKSGLIGVWHKDNLYLSTSTIGNGNPYPTNIDSRMRSIRMMPWSQLFFEKSFWVL
jgi:hypothetical protein